MTEFKKKKKKKKNIRKFEDFEFLFIFFMKYAVRSLNDWLEFHKNLLDFNNEISRNVKSYEFLHWSEFDVTTFCGILISTIDS